MRAPAYAAILLRQDKCGDALIQVEQLLARSPDSVRYRMMQVDALAMIGRHDVAAPICEKIVTEFPDHANAWVRYGQLLRTLGRTSDSIAAYRRALELSPEFGPAFWGLANLKTFRFSEDDEATMRQALERPELPDAERPAFLFAIGKAAEMKGDFRGSFGSYAEANRIRRKADNYHPHELGLLVERSKRLLTRSAFAEAPPSSEPVPGPSPIFIVGMPRSGSTLIEQILASHSKVEGTQELPELGNIAIELSNAFRLWRFTRGDRQDPNLGRA